MFNHGDYAKATYNLGSRQHAGIFPQVIEKVSMISRRSYYKSQDTIDQRHALSVVVPSHEDPVHYQWRHREPWNNCIFLISWPSLDMASHCAMALKRSASVVRSVCMHGTQQMHTESVNVCGEQAIAKMGKPLFVYRLALSLIVAHVAGMCCMSEVRSRTADS